MRKDEILSEYRTKRDLYRDFSRSVEAILRELLREKGINAMFITSREKNPDKLAEKIDRKKEEGEEYAKLTDIEDLAGARIVFYLESHKEEFQRIFWEDFRSAKPRVETKYKPTGYRGTHVIFSLDKRRVALPEYRRFKGLKCELQITSSLYHAWSEIEHDIIYKPVSSNKIEFENLGLNDLKKSFESAMTQYLQPATNKFEYFTEVYKKIVQASEIFTVNFISETLALTNDEIHERLEVAEAFSSKKSEEVLALAEAVIYKKPTKAVQVFRLGREIIYGKDQEDLILKSLSIINSPPLRYFKPELTLETIQKLSQDKSEKIKNEALRELKEFVEFNVHVLKQAGYAIQGKTFEYISAWPVKKQLGNLDFIQVILEENLKLSFSGTSSPTALTLTLHSGPVVTNDFLEKLRKDTIDLIYRLYENTPDPKVKKHLAVTLEEALRYSGIENISQELRETVKKDAVYLCEIYRKMLFKNRKLVESYAGIAAKIEDWLYYHRNTYDEQTNKAINALRNDILEDSFFKIFRSLIGTPLSYRDDKDYQKAQEKKGDDASAYVRAINSKNYKKWKVIIEEIASQQATIEDWEYQPFKAFLELLAEKKPEVAGRMLFEAFRSKSPLVDFLMNFLIGFRKAHKLSLWDKYIGLVVKDKREDLVGHICLSLMSDDGNETLRKKDLTLLGDLIEQRGQFRFIRKDFLKKGNTIYKLFSTLLSNFKNNRKEVEELMMDLLEDHESILPWLLNELDFSIHRKWVDVSQFQNKTKDFLLEKLVRTKKLDWHAQEFLINLTQSDQEKILKIFEKRIEYDVRHRERRNDDFTERYEAIPYHFHEKLQEIINGYGGLPVVMEKWIKKMSLRWSVYNWSVSNFLEHAKVDLKKVLLPVIEKSNDDDLLKMAYALEFAGGTDFELCMKIAEKTSSKDALSKLGSVMYKTGTVSGEHGISESYSGKAKALESYAASKNKKVSSFAKRMIESFKDSENQNREREDKDAGLREIRFAGL